MPAALQMNHLRAYMSDLPEKTCSFTLVMQYWPSIPQKKDSAFYSRNAVLDTLARYGITEQGQIKRQHPQRIWGILTVVVPAKDHGFPYVPLSHTVMSVFSQACLYMHSSKIHPSATQMNLPQDKYFKKLLVCTSPTPTRILLAASALSISFSSASLQAVY